MRRFAIFVTFVCFSSALLAQPRPGMPRPEDLSEEEFIQMQTRDMADWLDLKNDVRDKFISLYSAFRCEINSVAEQARPTGKVESEEEIDRAMQKNFEVSGQILQIRMKYYDGFRKFLKPSQIRQMYRFENEAGRRMHEGPGDRGGHDGPPEPERQDPEHFRMGPPPRY